MADSLEDLQRRIDKAEAANRPSIEQANPTPAPDALRLGVELTAGIAVGAGMGIVLDNWLNTSPWGLITCFLLGCAAGLVNLKRAADRVGK